MLSKCDLPYHIPTPAPAPKKTVEEPDVDYIAITTNEYSDLLRKESLLEIIEAMYRSGNKYYVQNVLDSVWGSESDA